MQRSGPGDSILCAHSSDVSAVVDRVEKIREAPDPALVSFWQVQVGEQRHLPARLRQRGGSPTVEQEKRGR